ARLPVYALVATAIAMHLRKRQVLSLCIGVFALFVHPIMALPGLLLLACLNCPIRVSLIGAVTGIVITLATALAAVVFPSVAIHVTIIDPVWLNVVQERSQFL